MAAEKKKKPNPKPKKAKENKQVMDGLGEDFETVMKKLVNPNQERK